MPCVFGLKSFSHRGFDLSLAFDRRFVEGRDLGALILYIFTSSFLIFIFLAPRIISQGSFLRHFMLLLLTTSFFFDAKKIFFYIISILVVPGGGP